jgi:hypothetical protein
MQTIQFIETARWIKEQFSPNCYRLLFEGEFFHIADTDSRGKMFKENILSITHEVVAVWPVLKSNALAVKVLQIFELDEALIDSMAVSMAKKAILLEDEASQKDIYLWVNKIFKKWDVLYGCLDPLEKLTTPVAVSEEKDFDEILTIELRLNEEINPPLKVILEILKITNGIYDDVCKLMCVKEREDLTAVYTTSGSSYRFDFTGSGEPIEQLKKLIVTLWNKFRYSEADRLRKNLTTAAEGLKLMQEIKDKRDKNVINDEDADKLTGKIMVGISNLFRSGATIREIYPVVMVSNQKLLEDLSATKLLPEATTPKEIKKDVKKKGEQTNKRERKKKDVKKKVEEEKKDEEENPPTTNNGLRG